MITIDVRWINASGIGTYIRHIVPGIVNALTEERFTLIGNSGDIKKLGITAGDRVQIVEAYSKMYSLHEQFEMPKLIPSNTRLFFSPHYPVPLRYKGKVLVTIHDVFHLAMPKLVGGFHKLLYAKLMFSQVCKRAAAIITDSRFTRSELEKYLPAPLPPIHTIHLGVDDSWFSVPNSEPIYSRPYLVFVGNIKPNKNLVSLIKAYSSISSKIPHDLIIIGKKSGFITSDSLVHELASKYPDRIIFTDLLPDQDLKRYIKGATALVFPSLYEGFGLPPLEAMACGCPVLSSDRASLPEVCGDAVLYCNPESVEDLANKLLQISTDTLLQEELRLKGLVQAQHFVWGKCIDQTLEVIRDLIR